MCQTICKSKRSKFFIAADCNPQTIEVCRVRAEPMGIEVVVADALTAKLDASYMGILLAYPATDGVIHDYSKVLAAAKVCLALPLFQPRPLAFSSRSENQHRTLLKRSRK